MVVDIVDTCIEQSKNASIVIQAVWRGYRIRRHDYFNLVIDYIQADNRSAKMLHLKRNDDQKVCFKNIEPKELPTLASRYLQQTDSQKYVDTIPMVAVLSICS